MSFKKYFQKLALWITNKVSTVNFFLIILLWTIIWLSWNIFAPKQFRFDPYPGFILWLFISNMIQILLMPLILVGQDLHTKLMEKTERKHFDISIHLEKRMKEILDEILLEIKKIENQE